jgi:glycosyltransferase involved in cell wall biosynthesis
MAAMRIAHVVARSHRRGAERAALELAHELDELGHENEVFALHPAFDGTTDPDLPTVTDRTGMGVLGLVSAVRAVRGVFGRRPRHDIVVAHGGWAMQARAVARRRGWPPIVWQRILDLPEGLWGTPRATWWRFVARRAHAAVVLTPANAVEMERLGFHGPVWPIPNSRRPDRFVSVDRVDARARLVAELGVRPGQPLVGLVGHLIAQKRPERAVDVLARVRAEGEDAVLVVAGDGPLRDAVRERSRERRVEEHVRMLGERTDVDQVLGGIDVLVLTSDSEGIPGIVIEAQMTGCPVVTFPLGAVAEVVADGETGVVLAEPDVAAMADAVVGLLRDPARRARCSAAARARSARFATSRTAPVYAARFEELRAARGARR